MKKQNVILSTIKIPYEEWISKKRLSSLLKDLKDAKYVGYTENELTGVTYMLYQGEIKPNRKTDTQ